MTRPKRHADLLIAAAFLAGASARLARAAPEPTTHTKQIGREVAIERHLKDDEEFAVPLVELIEYGKKLFSANWTDQEGAGRPTAKGTGRAVSDPTAKLMGSRRFNRVSGPDANSCAGCHNAPYSVPGGGGDFVANVFVLGQRFDFVTFDSADTVPTRGAVDEQTRPVTLDTVANSRATTGMFGAGYLEMMAREITEDLQRIRDGMKRGDSRMLESKGVNFGRLTRKVDGMWDVKDVVGLPRLSILTATPLDPPSLVIRPWHQASNVISLREFVSTASNHHFGIQSTERFGVGIDADGDGVVNEMSRADVTALAVYQATMAIPGQVVPSDPEVESAILNGEEVFKSIGCAECHVPALPLSRRNWAYTEPNPYNPPMNVRSGEVRTLVVDLMDSALPQPRLLPDSVEAEVLMVPAFTDFKLHDITDPGDPSSAEPIDMNQPVWSPKFTAGNRKFLTKRLWGCANEPPYYHHGLFTTLRQAVLAHSGEALVSRQNFEALTQYDRDSVIEFLKSLQVLPPGTKALVVDEHFRPKKWSAPH